MRLLRLYVHGHRVLKELDIHFDPAGESAASNSGSTELFLRNYYLDFLVGVNGTGKSTVLRILGRIFRQSFAELRDLPFILEYYREQNNQKIRITNINPQNEPPLERFSISCVSGLNSNFDENKTILADALDPSLLPERIIAYTTGRENEWFSLDSSDPFEQSDFEAIQNLDATERSIQELPGWAPIVIEKNQTNIPPRFRFIWQDQLPLLTLAGLLLHSVQNASPLQKVLQEASIECLAGFSLNFDLSYSSSIEHAEIWQMFGQHATRSIRNGGTLLLVFHPERFDTVLRANGGALALFERLADWQRRDIPLLLKINLFLKRQPKEDRQGKLITPPLHLWEWLSDGERSLIGRMCLFLLFGEVESLILLDEPEVHFNDYWKRHIVSMMSKVFEGKTAKSHVLIATHSSISLSDVPSEDVIILERPGVLTSDTREPDLQTFGADPSDIMVHVFGTPHAMGEYSVQEIESWFKDLYNQPTEKRKNYLEERLKRVSPGYWAYRIRREMIGLQLQ